MVTSVSGAPRAGMPRRALGSRGARSAQETFGEMRADYTAAKESRFRRMRKVISSGSGPDWHYRTQHDYLRIMEYSRDMDRNDCVLGSILDRATINTIQSGAILDFNTGSRLFDQDLMGGWVEWAHNAENIDVAGEDSFADMQSKSFRSSKVDGDIWAVGMDDHCLQWFEAHRVRTPSRTKRNIFQGVELDPFRKQLQIWVTKSDMSFDMTQTFMADFQPFPVRDGDIRRVFHVHTTTKKRFGQTRGVGALAPIFDMIGMHDDVEFAAVLKQQLQNALILFKERNEHYEGGPEEELGEQTQISRYDGSVETIENIGPGTMIKGKKGETLKGFTPTTPGADFFPHVKLLLTLIGVNLGMPLVLVMMDASETNFSGWRGAFDQAKLGFRENQRQMIRRFNTPVLNYHLAMRAGLNSRFERMLQKVREQSRRRGTEWYTWHLPSWPYVNPLDDRQADLIAVANYQEAPSTNMGRNGLDYEREMSRGIRDRGRAIELAFKEADRLNQMKAKLGIEDQPDITWDKLYTPLQPKFVQMFEAPPSDAAAGQGEPATKPNNKKPKPGVKA